MTSFTEALRSIWRRLLNNQYGVPIRKIEDGPIPKPTQTIRTRDKDVDAAAQKMDRRGYHVRRQKRVRPKKKEDSQESYLNY